MEEMFKNISKRIKDLAETCWNLALAQDHPKDAAEFLNTVLRIYDRKLTEEEMEYLQFYFALQMEMINK